MRYITLRASLNTTQKRPHIDLWDQEGFPAASLSHAEATPLLEACLEHAGGGRTLGHQQAEPFINPEKLVRTVA